MSHMRIFNFAMFRSCSGARLATPSLSPHALYICLVLPIFRLTLARLIFSRSVSKVFNGGREIVEEWDCWERYCGEGDCGGGELLGVGLLGRDIVGEWVLGECDCG